MRRQNVCGHKNLLWAYESRWCSKKLLFLAACLKDGKEELICDLAETYRLHDCRKYKPSHVGMLAAGLPEKSRTKMRMSGNGSGDAPDILILLARAVDELATIRWFMSDDGAKGRNRPRQLTPMLLGKNRGEEMPGRNPSADTPQELLEKLGSYG